MAKQTGAEYREKNRIRLQRHYERQAAAGKKRVSALVSDEAYRLLTDQKAQSGESFSSLINQAVLVVYGEKGIPDVDDVSKDFLAAYGGPDPADTPAAVEPDLEADQGGYAQAPDTTGQTDDPPDPDQGMDTRTGPAIDNNAGQDQAEPNALVDQEPDTIADQVDNPSAAKVEDPDQIPDCTGREITRDERDKILVQVFEAMPDKPQAQARVDLLNRKGIPVSVGTRQFPYGGEWDKKKFTDNLRLAKKRLGIK